MSTETAYIHSKKEQKFYGIGLPRILDLTSTDANLKGFYNGFTDGKYGYLAPNYDGSNYSGKIARIDLSNFLSVSVLDLTGYDATLKGFTDCFTDGRYGYFVPYYNGSSYSGKVARIDLANWGTIVSFNLAVIDSDLVGFQSGFSDGQYGYFIPYIKAPGTYSGKIARLDLRNFSTVNTLDLTTIDSDLKGFVGCFTDGKYAYLVPNNNGSPFGKLVRIDLSDFSTVSVLDLTSTDSDLKGFQGGFTDGRYGYLVPFYNGSSYFGKVARVDLLDFSTVTVLDLTSTDNDLKGFIHGFTDNRYGYFVPNNNGSVFGKVARVDLTDFSTVAILDLTTIDATLKGFRGGFADGKYGYLVPYNNGSFFGKLVRLPMIDYK